MLVMQAYMFTGERAKAREMAEKVKLYAAKRDNYHRLIEYYIVTGDTTTANQLIAKAGSVELDKDFR